MIAIPRRLMSPRWSTTAALCRIGLATLAAIAAALAVASAQPTVDAQPPAYRSVQLTLADTLGGAVTGVAVDAATGIAYVSRGERVEALDVTSDPTAPKVLATSERLRGVARVIGAAGGRVFVAVRQTVGDGTTVEALLVLSTADPTGLTVLGTLALSPKIPAETTQITRIERAFAADAGTAYFVAAETPHVLTAIDLRGWPAIRQAAIAMPSMVNGLAVAGTTLVAATTAGLTAVDVSDPAAPKRVGALALEHGARGVATLGTTAYATTDDGLAMVDFSDPAHLSLRRPVDETCSRGWDVAVADGRAWVVQLGGGPFPHEVAMCALDPTGDERVAHRQSWSLPVIAGAGDTLLLADGRYGLTALRPSDTTPGAIDAAWNVATLGDASGLAVGVGVVRAVDPDSEVWSFDTTDPARPRLLGRNDVASRIGTSTHSAGLVVRDRLAFLSFIGTRAWGGSVAALDFAVPDPIGVLGEWYYHDVPEERQYDIDSGYSPTNEYGPYLSGNTLFLTGGTVPLTAIDVTDPADPRWLGRFGGKEPYYEGGGLALDGTTAWIALMDQGVGVLDVADPTTPVLIDQIRLPGSTQDVARVGNHVLATTMRWTKDGTSESALVVLDASTRAPIGRLPMDVPGFRLVVAGTHAFVYGDGEIVIVDVRDPTRPVEVGRARTGVSNSWNALPLAVVGDTVWAGAGDLGIAVFRMTDGGAFTRPPAIYLPYGAVPRP